MNLEQPAGDPQGRNRPGAPVLVIAADSLPLWRRLGPIGWMALQYLALSSHPSEQGWAAPVGVRDIAAGIGVTKDTAAVAVSRVMAIGLLSRESVSTPGGRRRSGYVLHFPDTMWLADRPDGRDGASVEQARCPGGEYTRRTINRLPRIPHPDTRRSRSQPRAGTGNGAGAPEKESPPRSWGQPVLFDAATGPRAPSSTGTGDER